MSDTPAVEALPDGVLEAKMEDLAETMNGAVKYLADRVVGLEQRVNAIVKLLGQEFAEDDTPENI